LHLTTFLSIACNVPASLACAFRIVSAARTNARATLRLKARAHRREAWLGMSAHRFRSQRIVRVSVRTRCARDIAATLNQVFPGLTCQIVEVSHFRGMQGVHKPTARSSTTNRSAVTNGSKLLVGIDGRSPSARRFRDLVQAYTAEIGGDLSQTEMAMIKTAASLSLSAEMMQADIVNGKIVDADELIRLSSEVRRILDAIAEKAGKRKPAAAVMDLHDHAAKRALERAKAQPAEGSD